ncbi:hypothetical protein BD626DRAFT_625797 [Schizophyllum amplum]|uniref:Uncharacterized protein n=1 Tax=Schizophyllum amplum TaxID=97359 RepID=A0A550D0W5_9AGAR|nr:hypothetical protein BD626DRAFT_625797 [Auriculariopsis ampla]
MLLDDSSHIHELMAAVETSLPHLRDDEDGVVNTEALAYELLLDGNKVFVRQLQNIMLRFAKHAAMSTSCRNGHKNMPVAVRGIFYFFADLISFTIPGKKWTSTTPVERPEDELVFAPHLTSEDLLRVLRLNSLYGALYSPPDFGRLSSNDRKAHREARNVWKKSSGICWEDEARRHEGGPALAVMDIAFWRDAGSASLRRLALTDDTTRFADGEDESMSADKQEEQEVEHFLKLELALEVMNDNDD